MSTTVEPLADVRPLLEMIRTHAEAIERARRLPEPLVTALIDAGCFRLFAPDRWTGGAPAYSQALQVIALLAEADASVAWVVSQSALGQAIVGHLPAAARAAIYASGGDVPIAGVFAPKGHATRTAEGWSVSGQWPYASGCELAAYVYLQCLVTENRRVLMTPADEPVTRLAVFARSDVEILDTWQAVGLRGSGSHDVTVRARACPDEWTCALAEADGAGEGLQGVLLMDQAGLLIAAVAVGIAAGAVRDASALAAAGKRPAFSPRRLSEDPLFLHQLGEAHMRVRAARALLADQARLVDALIARRTVAPLDRASLRATCHHVTALAANAVDTAYALGRTSSILATSPLQRRFRDMHTVTQHAWSAPDFAQHVGATLLREA